MKRGEEAGLNGTRGAEQGDISERVKKTIRLLGRTMDGATPADDPEFIAYQLGETQNETSLPTS